MRKSLCATIGAVLFLCSLGGPSVAGAKTYVACDGVWVYDAESDILTWDDSSVKWRSRPSRCFLDTDGTSAGQVNLQKMSWKHWGRRVATASGVRLASRESADGSIAESNVTIRASGRVRACKRKRPNHWYYTKFVISAPDFGTFSVRPMLPSWQCKYRGE